jgi:hypothetical protein
MRGKWSAVIALCVVFVTGAVFAEAPAKTDISVDCGYGDDAV